MCTVDASHKGAKKRISQINDVVDFYVKTMYNGHEWGKKWNITKKKALQGPHTRTQKKVHNRANWSSKNIQPNRDYSIERTKDYQRWIRILCNSESERKCGCARCFLFFVFHFVFIHSLVRSFVNSHYRPLIQLKSQYDSNHFDNNTNK